MDTKQLRNFRMEDEAMLVQAQVKHDSLSDALGLFTARFPFIDAAFLTDFQAKISTAEAIALDNQHVANKSVLTAELKRTMVSAYELLRTLGIYAKLAYSKGDKRQRALGQDSWTKARFNKDKLIDVLDLAHKKLSEEPFKTDLPAKGFTPAQITQLATYANELRTEGAEQKSANKNRPISTQERITALNAVWEVTVTLRLAAQVVYDSNPAQRKVYNLYPAKHKKKEKNTKAEPNEE